MGRRPIGLSRESSGRIADWAAPLPRLLETKTATNVATWCASKVEIEMKEFFTMQNLPI